MAEPRIAEGEGEPLEEELARPEPAWRLRLECHATFSTHRFVAFSLRSNYNECVGARCVLIAVHSLASFDAGVKNLGMRASQQVAAARETRR